MANLLTLSRLLLVPVVYWYAVTGQNFWAAFVFVLAALTDLFDGLVARTRGEVSNLGKLMDPIADKALQLATLALVVRNGYAPLWLIVVLLSKEVALLLGGLWLLKLGHVVSARFWGKVASVLLFVALAAGLAGLFVFRPLLYMGAAFSLVAGCDYLMQAVHTLSSRRTMG